MVNYRKGEAEARETARLINSSGGKAFPFRANVSDFAEVEAMFDACVREYGHIDVLVNNAGVSTYSLITSLSVQEWDEVVDVNLKGTFLCCRAALTRMVPKRTGSIINIASIWGLVGAACEAHYSASKGGVIAFTKALAKEVGPSRVRANAIAPGVISTDMLSSLDEDALNDLREKTPLGRLGTPDDIAKCALYLASADSDFMTGQVLSPNGGFVIA